MQHGTQHQTRVGAAPGDDDLSALSEDLSNGRSAEINVGALHAGTNGGKGVAGIEIFHFDTLSDQ